MEADVNVMPKSEWVGVEVVSGDTQTRSSMRLATGATVILGIYLLAIQFAVPWFGTSSYGPFEYFDPRLFWPSLIILLMIGWAFVFSDSQLVGNAYGKTLTLNTEAGPANASELVGGLLRPVGILYPSASRNFVQGRLAISGEGIQGVVTIPWRKVLLVEPVSENTVRIRKRELLPSLARAMGLNPIIMRFANATDAVGFLHSVRTFLLKGGNQAR